MIADLSGPVFLPPSTTVTTQTWEKRLELARRDMATMCSQRPRSHSLVMEAAFFLLQAGVLNVPLTGKVNVKQGWALLHIAAWLQVIVSQEWIDAGYLSPSPECRKTLLRKLAELLMALVGPAGTGKTSLIKVADALVEHFLGDGSSARLALSNTAARLFGADTAHSWWKLPNKTLQGNQKFLSKRVLERHRARWAKKRMQFVDEISMMSPAQLFQGFRCAL